MRNVIKELEVDFIGGQDAPMTEEEEQAISDFICANKEKRNLQKINQKTPAKRKIKQVF